MVPVSTLRIGMMSKISLYVHVHVIIDIRLENRQSRYVNKTDYFEALYVILNTFVNHNTEEVTTISIVLIYTCRIVMSAKYFIEIIVINLRFIEDGMYLVCY